jgi:hypothetical protein
MSQVIDVCPLSLTAETGNMLHCFAVCDLDKASRNLVKTTEGAEAGISEVVSNLLHGEYLGLRSLSFHRFVSYS